MILIFILLLLSSEALSRGSDLLVGPGRGAFEFKKDVSLADTSVKKGEKSLLEFLPIISYDTDAGIGYGVKTFFLNFLEKGESVDLVLFMSTKGERWYRLVFSLPDFEKRQGKVYPLALDIVADYDRWNSYSFFGTGNASKYADRETYTREPFDVSLSFSRGFTAYVVAQLGVRFKAVRNFNFSENGTLARLTPESSQGRAQATSFCTSLRYDTRHSYINPSSGVVISLEAETSPHLKLNDAAMSSLSISLQNYAEIMPNTVIASRFSLKGVAGEDLPLQFLLGLGGGSSLRGYVQDRFLDKVSAVFNAEARFPIYWRFGGIIGMDGGKVWEKISDMDLKRWAFNPAVGLRFYFDTFIVRLDAGVGPETIGVYLNFGHIF